MLTPSNNDATDIVPPPPSPIDEPAPTEYQMKAMLFQKKWAVKAAMIGTVIPKDGMVQFKNGNSYPYAKAQDVIGPLGEAMQNAKLTKKVSLVGISMAAREI